MSGLVAALLVTLRWMQPAGSPPVEAFRVYLAAHPSRPGLIVYQGIPAPDELGAYSTSIEVGGNVFGWVTALNSIGESEPSNARLFVESTKVRGTRRQR